MQDCTNRPERLDKLLASSGLVSRSEAKTAVARGRVTVDGISARSPEQKVTRGADIRLDGIPVDTSPFLYIMLNKPAGYVCSTEDGDGPTVLDLLAGPDIRRGLFPAGRLDKDTVGLLILTNDGATLAVPEAACGKALFFPLCPSAGRSGHCRARTRGRHRRPSDQARTPDGGNRRDRRENYDYRGKIPSDQADVYRRRERDHFP